MSCSAFIRVAGLIVCALFVSTAGALTPEDKCEFKKNKIAGKYSFCRQKAEAKAIKKETAPDFSKCDEKLLKKWAKEEEKAAKKDTTCIDSVSGADIQSFVTEHSDAVAAALDGGSVPTCGDDLINAVGEQCDGTDLGGEDCESLGFIDGGSLGCDGNCGFDTSGCVGASATQCGDGILEGVEECEWGVPVGSCLDLGYVGPGTPDCIPATCVIDDTTCVSKVVFATSAAFQGDLGGVAGADALCQAAASNAGLSGTFLAWISSNAANDPESRFAQSLGPYVLVDDTILADNWSDLTDGSLDAPIDLDEFGSPRSGTVWTGTASDGTVVLGGSQAGSACLGWTTNVGGFTEVGLVGSTSESDFNWTANGSGACIFSNGLYCFEQ